MRILNLCLSTVIVSVTASLSTLQIASPTGPVTAHPTMMATADTKPEAPQIKGPAADWIVMAAARVWDDYEESPEEQRRLRNTAMLNALRP